MIKRNDADNNKVLWGLFFEKILENMDALTIVSDARGKVVFANRKCLDFLRLSAQDFLERNWIDMIIPGYDAGPVKKIFRQMKEKMTLGCFDGSVSASGGGDIFLSWIGIPLIVRKRKLYMFIARGKNGANRKFKHHPRGSRKYNTAYKEVIEALFKASKTSEPETARHAERVMVLAEKLARRIRMSGDRIEKLKVASILHDLGKLAVDEKILFKKGKLTGKEFEEIKKHPHWGAEVVKLVYFLRDIIPIMANHHENYDGSGYPGGIKGDKIPLEARVLSIADIYEALTADRPYRKGYSREEAVSIMEKEKGRKLDPELTCIFIDMVNNGEAREDLI